MLGQIIEVVESDRRLTLEYGSLVIQSSTLPIARVALDNIQAVIVNPHGATLSAGIISALAERGIPLVFSGPHFKPTAVVMPLIGHHEIAARIQLQVEASKPFGKQAWKQVVKSKLLMQALALEAVGVQASQVRDLIPTVRSGDPVNVEAQAARRYWPLMFGPDFRRRRDEPGLNALLNYGYAVIRAAMARAISASGLHPSIGIHHRNSMDTMRLVDDFMEPYRPLVDVRVFGISQVEEIDVVPRTKKMVVSLLRMDVPTDVGTSPLSVAMYRTASSFVKYLRGERETLELPGAQMAGIMQDAQEAYV